MKNWVKIPYEAGKKTVGAIRKMNVTGTANAAMNVATGAALVSMLPTSAGASTDNDIDRMKQYPSKRLADGRQQTADGGRGDR